MRLIMRRAAIAMWDDNRCGRNEGRDMRHKTKRTLEVLALALLMTAVFFTACGAAGPAYTRATMRVYVVGEMR